MTFGPIVIAASFALKKQLEGTRDPILRAALERANEIACSKESQDLVNHCGRYTTGTRQSKAR